VKNIHNLTPMPVFTWSERGSKTCKNIHCNGEMSRKNKVLNNIPYLTSSDCQSSHANPFFLFLLGGGGGGEGGRAGWALAWIRACY
jgi:hypothetical protein